MPWLNSAITSGMIFDIIAALMVIEVIVLVAHRRLSGRGLATRAVLTSVGAGFCLILAFKAFLAGAAVAWIGLFLSGALAAHLLDLEYRLRR